MFEDRTAPYAAFVLRVSLGIMYISHSLLKVFVFTLPGAVGFFQASGVPGELAYVVALAEFGGGILLVFGVYTRWMALALLPVLIASVIFVHGANGWYFANKGGGWEYSVFLIAASIVQVLLGDGAYALKLPWLPGRRASNSGA